jgi:flagellar secretion chaperone FliS
MNQYNPYQNYQQVQVETSDQKQLILMVYDAAVRFCQEARLAMMREDLTGKGKSIQRAFDAISELRKSLNMEKGGEVAEGLNKLYAFLGHQLTLANLNNDKEILDSVITVLNDLRGTWAQAFDKMEEEEAALVE